jgi:hypothetical protein
VQATSEFERKEAARDNAEVQDNVMREETSAANSECTAAMSFSEGEEGVDL